MKLLHSLVLLLVILCSIANFLKSAHGAELYHGRVIDEETGEPIAGAVLTVVWYTTPIISMERGMSFLSAQETLTDSDGKFLLLAEPAIDWNPFTIVRKPPDTVVIYKPGYVPLEPGSPAWKQVASFGSTHKALQKGPTIKLPKLKDKEEAWRFSNLGAFAITDVPYDKIPKLLKAVNVQRELIGLQLYPEKN